MRRAVYDAAPPAWRLDAHERAAAALARRGAGPAARAYHVARFARAGDEAAIALLSAAAAAAARHVAGDRRALVRRARCGCCPTATPRAARGCWRRWRSRWRTPAGSTTAAGGARRGARAAPGRPDAERLELVSACAQLETQLGRHAEARRRLLAALRGAPAAGQAAIAFELAADAMTHGRSEELRAWAEPRAGWRRAASRSCSPGAQTLAALGALWTRGAAPTRPALDRAAARSTLSTTAPGARVGVLVQVSRAQLRLGRYRRRGRDDRGGRSRSAAARRTSRSSSGCGSCAPGRWSQLLDLDAALVEVDAAEESARLQRAPHPLLLVAVQADARPPPPRRGARRPSAPRASAPR